MLQVLDAQLRKLSATACTGSVLASTITTCSGKTVWLLDFRAFCQVMRPIFHCHDHADVIMRSRSQIDTLAITMLPLDFASRQSWTKAIIPSGGRAPDDSRVVP